MTATSLAELRAFDMLRGGTQAFVRENDAAIARALERVVPGLEREARALKGAAGLLIKKRFLEAKEPWEKYFWARLSVHHVRETKPLEEALRLADEDVLMLSTVMQPL
jgi:hypothetical protein